MNTNILAVWRPSGPVMVGCLTLAIAATLQWCCWGFTVDDAWIISRVAAHGEAGLGFVFNAGSSATDAITPLGFAQFLAYAGRVCGLSGAWELFLLSRWVGIFALFSSLLLALELSRRQSLTFRWWQSALLLPLCMPAFFWAGAGLSTPLVGLFIISGAALLETSGPRKFLGGLLLGAAISWRPELAPAGLALFVISQSQALLTRSGFGLTSTFLMLPVATAAIRFLYFDSWLPLSFLAKVPEFSHGLRYALVTLIWAGLPWLLFARATNTPQSWRWVWLVHLVALIFAGGDWMPAMRLTVPLYPWLLWKVAISFDRWRSKWFALLLLPAFFGPVMLLGVQGDDLRAVTQRRLALVDAARPLFRTKQIIAAVDIGWIGLATEAHIVDLAGVTDPTIAQLPGGHTSKLISPGLFSDRDVDTWVIRAANRSYRLGDPLDSVHAVYWVDAKLLSKNLDLDFKADSIVPLPGTNGQYIIAKRR